MLPWYFLNIYLGVFTMTALSAHNYELRPFYFKSAIFDFRKASDSARIILHHSYHHHYSSNPISSWIITHCEYLLNLRTIYIYKYGMECNYCIYTFSPLDLVWLHRLLFYERWCWCYLLNIVRVHKNQRNFCIKEGVALSNEYIGLLMF